MRYSVAIGGRGQGKSLAVKQWIKYKMTEKALKAVSQAIREATSAAPFYVAASQYRDKYMVYEATELHQSDRAIDSFISHEMAEELCEQLNYDYIARKAIEAVINELPSRVMPNS